MRLLRKLVLILFTIVYVQSQIAMSNIFDMTLCYGFTSAMLLSQIGLSNMFCCVGMIIKTSNNQVDDCILSCKLLCILKDNNRFESEPKWLPYLRKPRQQDVRTVWACFVRCFVCVSALNKAQISIIERMRSLWTITRVSWRGLPIGTIKSTPPSETLFKINLRNLLRL